MVWRVVDLVWTLFFRVTVNQKAERRLPVGNASAVVQLSSASKPDFANDDDTRSLLILVSMVFFHYRNSLDATIGLLEWAQPLRQSVVRATQFSALVSPLRLPVAVSPKSSSQKFALGDTRPSARREARLRFWKLISDLSQLPDLICVKLRCL